jgi:diadenylate cyclase
MTRWEAIGEWFETTPFAQAGWVDVLDILVLAWVVYRVLVALEGTRAMRSLVGLGLLLVVYVAAEAIGLVAVRWVLDHLFVYAVLALIILFQEDIRRALARAGDTLGRLRGGSHDAALVEEIVRATFALAHRRLGALVVLERAASLEAYLESSHRLDAAASAELLQALFHPTSPLHDGAVVLAKGRVAAAGVFLPIALSPDHGRLYGTRHRAAIGLTEVSDAVCVVVSEERGTVSLAVAGAIVPVADANDLRARLSEALASSVPRGEPMPAEEGA